MTDVFNKSKRSRIMALVKGKDTKPEINIRKALFSRGFRYRLHDRKLFGSPDLIFPRYKAIIFIHGCFWHNHGCRNGRLPASNVDFWEKKLTQNSLRDQKNIAKLKKLGWKVLIIWSCSLKGKNKVPSEIFLEETINWIKS